MKNYKLKIGCSGLEEPLYVEVEVLGGGVTAADVKDAIAKKSKAMKEEGLPDSPFDFVETLLNTVCRENGWSWYDMEIDEEIEDLMEDEQERER